MQGPPTGFWAKLDEAEDGSIRAWHPLVDHAADVASCCEAILTGTLLGNRLARVGGLNQLSSVQIARLCFLSALHDLGKINLGFQAKSESSAQSRAGHVMPILALFAETGYEASRRLLEVLPIEELVSWTMDENAAAGLLFATFCHHGQPYRIEAAGPHDPKIWRPTPERDPYEEASRLVDAAFDWFPEARSGNGDSSDLLPRSAAFQHAYNGLLTLADWLGSDEERFFPFSTEDGGARIAFARERAADALQWIGLDARSARTSLGLHAPTFSSVCPHEPRNAQRAIVDLSVPGDASLTILEAETGSGKTEAALARYLRLFHAGEVDGLYFALPTRAAAKQIHRRVLEAVRMAFPSEDCRPPVVLAVPGYIRVDEAKGSRTDEEGRRLPNFNVLWEDSPSGRLRDRRWAGEAPKRYLAGSVVVGTVDQALLSSLMVRHCHLRATSLLRHLLVVDEVHASDPYMTKLLEEVLRFHLSAGGHGLLMSATLGSSARCRYLRIVDPSRSRAESLEAALARPYPSVEHLGRSGAPVLAGPEADCPPKQIRIQLEPWITEEERIVALALEAARDGARVLVLRNTVADCLATQEALERAVDGDLEPPLFEVRGRFAPHHSRFAAADRLLLDDAIVSAFGEDRPFDGCVAVTTQTVEQSLDIDADLLITDLAPMDVLLQRAGRLHRHTREVRPPAYEKPHLVVLTPADRDLGKRLKSNGKAGGRHGLGSVYEDLRVIEATWSCLERHGIIEIPAMNRELVERTTHPDALEAIVDSLGGPWKMHQSHIIGSILAEGRIASLNLIDRDTPFGELAFPSKEVAGKIRSRLGAEDRVVHFPEPVVGPFGEEIAKLTIPEHQVRNTPLESEPEDLVQADGSVTFRLGSIGFRYDRCGLARRSKEESKAHG